MDTLYTVNPGSNELTWGSPANPNQSSTLTLGFAGHRIAVIPGQRYLYITGNKIIGGEPHAHLAVIDTCDHTVTAEIDLGVGFAGQCAVPHALEGNRAFVAISRAVGNVISNGQNRVSVLNVLNPSAPFEILPAFIIGGSDYGTLHIVWSSASSIVYTAHRGDSTVHYFNPRGALEPPIFLSQQPTALAIGRSGHVLYVAQRLNGALVEVDLTVDPPIVGQAHILPNAISASTMFLALDPLDRVYVTSSRVADGFVNVFHRPLGGAPQIQSIDVQGQNLGQPAVNPEGTVLFVPRGMQNDVALIELSTLTLFPIPISAGTSPTDTVVSSLEAGVRIVCTPEEITAPCNGPVEVVVRALDPCGTEISGVGILATTTDPGNVSISPVPPISTTPATFEVECQQGGTANVNFSMTEFPYVTKTVSVQCNCSRIFCYEFDNFTGGFLPGSGGAFADGLIWVDVPPGGQIWSAGPQIIGTELRLFQGSVRFQLMPPYTVDLLTVRLTRHDSFPHFDTITVTHSGGVTTLPSPNTGNGLRQGQFEIVAPFTGITQWTIRGGQETAVRGICFWASF